MVSYISDHKCNHFVIDVILTIDVYLGKDRTAMGVTLSIARDLVEECDVVGGKQVCATLRQYGVRRMNVYANTGQSMYAFGQLDRLALPACFNPPSQTCSGNVNG